MEEPMAPFMGAKVFVIGGNSGIGLGARAIAAAGK
jgi:NAD(P)-dependent dehydrogenase (short-subunit alcohol dehydrogenase family)